MDTLTLAEASAVGGVPQVQLKRWAWEDWDTVGKRAGGQVGPRNVGTRSKPLYLDQDVREWRQRAGGDLVGSADVGHVPGEAVRRANTIRERVENWP